MDEFDILVSHPLTNTSLLIWLPLECECKPLLKWPGLLSFYFQVFSIRSYSFCTFGRGVVKWRVKFEKKSIWLTVFQIKLQTFMWPHFVILKVIFWEKSELSKKGVVWLNLSIENPFNVSRPSKSIFENLHSFFLFFHTTRSQWKTMIGTSKPYTRAMRGTFTILKQT